MTIKKSGLAALFAFALTPALSATSLPTVPRNAPLRTPAPVNFNKIGECQRPADAFATVQRKDWKPMASAKMGDNPGQQTMLYLFTDQKEQNVYVVSVVPRGMACLLDKGALLVTAPPVDGIVQYTGLDKTSPTQRSPVQQGQNRENCGHYDDTLNNLSREYRESVVVDFLRDGGKARVTMTAKKDNDRTWSAIVTPIDGSSDEHYLGAISGDSCIKSDGKGFAFHPDFKPGENTKPQAPEA